MAKASKLAVVKNNEEVSPLLDVFEITNNLAPTYFTHKKFQYSVGGQGFTVDFLKAVEKIESFRSSDANLEKRIRKPKLKYNVNYKVVDGGVEATLNRGVEVLLQKVMGNKKEYESGIKEIMMKTLEDAGAQVVYYHEMGTKVYLEYVKELAEMDALEGLFTELPESVYRASPGLSKSEVFPLEKSMNHYEHQKANPLVPTSAMKFGSLAHLKVLEPEKYKKSVIVMDLNRVKTEDKIQDLVNNIVHAKKFIASSKDEKSIQAVEINLASHPVIVPLIRESKKEVAIFYKKNGELRKGKVDGFVATPTQSLANLISSVLPYSEEEVLKSAIVWDIKSTKNMDARKFGYDIDDKGYHIQMGGYSDGLSKILNKPVICILLLLENTAPYQWDFHAMSPSDLEDGITEFDRLSEKLKLHQENPLLWKGLPLKKKEFISRPAFAIKRSVEADENDSDAE